MRCSILAAALAVCALTFGSAIARAQNASTLEASQVIEVQRGKTKPPVITAVAILPGGGQVATAGDDHVVRIWSAENGRIVHTLSGHSDWVRGLPSVLIEICWPCRRRSPDHPRQVATGNSGPRLPAPDAVIPGVYPSLAGRGCLDTKFACLMLPPCETSALIGPGGTPGVVYRLTESSWPWPVATGRSACGRWAQTMQVEFAAARPTHPGLSARRRKLVSR
jgi:hypothetical protein